MFLLEVFGEEGGETGFGVGCKVFADGTVAVEDCEEGVVGNVGEGVDGAVGVLIGFVWVCGMWNVACGMCDIGCGWLGLFVRMNE